MLLLFAFLNTLLAFKSVAQNADALSGVLTLLANDGLGVSTLQSEYNSLAYTAISVDPQSAVEELSSVLDGKFEKRRQVAMSLKYEAERLLNLNINQPLKRCCSLPDSSLKYDSRFSDNIDLRGQCNRMSSPTGGALYNVGDGLLSLYEKHLRENPTLKWQYFASEDSLISIYPAFKVPSCGNYDPRFRPWYVTASVPEPKDVVVIIDKSGSMKTEVGSSSRMDLAKEAADTVLGTLNPHDRVGIVAFSTHVQLPGEDSCFSSSLARASTVTVTKLKNFVNNLVASGTTNYKLALSTAFNLFSGTPPLAGASDVKRDKVILFLTDGAPTSSLGSNSDIMQKIYEKNRALGFEVVILTFGMGDTIGSAGSILKDIANQDFIKYNVAVNNSAKAGKADIVESDSKIRQELGSYYSFFAPDVELVDPILTVPYYDLFGLGVVLTIAVPVYSSVSQTGKGRQAGVVGIDITLADLIYDITFYGQSKLSYAFLIDNAGVTLTHPLLPNPTNIDKDPTYVDISTLEHQTTNFQQVRTSMVNGGNGSLLLDTKWSVPLGDSKMEGVRQDAVRARYTWLPIADTDYSLCLVVAESFTIEYVPSFQVSVTTSSYLYHRFDLIPPPRSRRCSQFGRLAISDEVTFNVVAKGFKDPFAYLDLQQTTSIAQKYVSYLSGATNANDYFNPTVRASLVTIYRIVSSWTRAGNDYTKFIVWRYVGTQDGVFIVLPGIQQNKKFDHTQRPWYKRTVASSGKVVLSAPYVDGFGAGYVITLSHSIVSGGGSTSEIAAVAAMDFTLPYFWTQIIDSYPECERIFAKRCIVIDNAGFVVMHPNFVDPSVSSVQGVKDKHITEIEDGISSSLISRGIMVKGECNDLQKKRVNNFWKVDVPGGSQNVVGSFITYEIKEISGTNSFLIISERWDDSTSCYCDKNEPLGTRACTGSASSCQCPCSNTLSYVFCEGLDSVKNPSVPVCPPGAPSLSLPPQASDATDSLPSCLNIDCRSKTQKSDCFGIVGCEWCSYDYASGSPLSSPYCEDSVKCPLGSKGSKFPSSATEKPTTSEKDKSDSGIPIGSIVAIIVLVVLAAVGLAWCYKRKMKRSAQAPAPTPAPAAASSSPSAPPASFEYNKPTPYNPSAPPPAYDDVAYRFNY